MEKSYIDWLLQKIDNPRNQDYEDLFAILWEQEFYSLVDNDSNRAEDGLSLRKMWERKTRQRLILGPPRVLEVLIYLAMRARDVLYDGDFTISVDALFWEFLTNLGLDFYNNKKFEGYTHDDNRLDVIDILDKWLKREFQRNGKGGVFPLKNPKKDQRDEELWYQMNYYLMENYSIL
jgi:hypothetical protein